MKKQIASSGRLTAVRTTPGHGCIRILRDGEVITSAEDYGDGVYRLRSSAPYSTATPEELQIAQRLVNKLSEPCAIHGQHHVWETRGLAVPPSGVTPGGDYVYYDREVCGCGDERFVRHQNGQ